jgi:uncharacterized membrane protein
MCAGSRWVKCEAGMSWYAALVGPLAMVGLAIASYILHTESQLDALPGYIPACDGVRFLGIGGSCSTVFRSDPAHILRYWQLVPKGHWLDLSLGQCAVPYFTVMGGYVVGRRRLFLRQLYAVLIILGPCFTAYLAYLLKVVVQEFCIVCAATYVLNAALCTAIYMDMRFLGRQTKSKSKVA